MARKILVDEWLQGDVEQVKFKKKAVGKKGQLLVELQKSYKGDTRFKLNDKFDEVDVQKLPKKFKDIQSDLIKQDSDDEDDSDFENNNNNLDEEQQAAKSHQDEINKQLSILTSIMPEHAAFISYQKKEDKKKYNLLIPKFDPTNIDKRLIKKKEEVKKQDQKNKLEISKGVDKKTLKIDKANKLLKRIEQKQEIKLNIDKGAWKSIIQNDETKQGLFS